MLTARLETTYWRFYLVASIRPFSLLRCMALLKLVRFFWAAKLSPSAQEIVNE